MIDRFDVLGLMGLLALGAAIWLSWGLGAVLAYAGVVLLFVGVGGAMFKVHLAQKRQAAPPTAE